MQNDEYWNYLDQYLQRIYPDYINEKESTKVTIEETKTYGWDDEFKAGDKVEFLGLKGVVNGDLEVSYSWQVPVELNKAEGRLVILNADILKKR